MPDAPRVITALDHVECGVATSLFATAFSAPAVGQIVPMHLIRKKLGAKRFFSLRKNMVALLCFTVLIAPISRRGAGTDFRLQKKGWCGSQSIPSSERDLLQLFVCTILNDHAVLYSVS